MYESSEYACAPNCFMLDDTSPTLAFQDEKDFKIQVKTSRQNDHVYWPGLKN